MEHHSISEIPTSVVTHRLYCSACKCKTKHISKHEEDQFHCVVCGGWYFSGVIKNDMLRIGIPPNIARAIELEYWGLHDSLRPKSPTETCMDEWVKSQGKSPDYIGSYASWSNIITETIQS